MFDNKILFLYIFIFKGFIIEPCRSCKSEVESKSRQCPYCGVLNPTVKLKDIFKGIFIVIAVMSVVTYFVNLS